MGCRFGVFDVRTSSFALRLGAPAEADERGGESESGTEELAMSRIGYGYGSECHLLR